PAAIAVHRHEPSIRTILRRNYRWGYSSIEAKFGAPTVRMSWLYRFPALTLALTGPLALAQAVYIVRCWVRAGRRDAIAAFPVLLMGRLAYAWGAMVGGVRWLLARSRSRLLLSHPVGS